MPSESEWRRQARQALTAVRKAKEPLPPVTPAVAALRAAGGSAWDRVTDDEMRDIFDRDEPNQEPRP